MIVVELSFNHARLMTKISPQPRVKLSRLRDIGWALWDPICLLDSSEHTSGKWYDEANKAFADEYDSYLISAATQLRSGASQEAVVEYLFQIETQHMELDARRDTRTRAEAVVNAILADELIWTFPDEQGRFD